MFLGVDSWLAPSMMIMNPALSALSFSGIWIVEPSSVACQGPEKVVVAVQSFLLLVLCTERAKPKKIREFKKKIVAVNRETERTWMCVLLYYIQLLSISRLSHFAGPTEEAGKSCYVCNGGYAQPSIRL
ncbi:hypothetical protein K435DRAFT_374227 [Dendrothele bispora CBS 962.96]|uniref:Uncharacterized protein n=1 Tax=Dendrothele bispora (strain CBS 962.96) TaxID=1314807 RepID=A0A4S8LB43_DENBC|nr:hypothetical protein K435DRAFT_374227 [Dendrothele bispora CBS 962.96]